jgi:hypothetical protein
MDGNQFLVEELVNHARFVDAKKAIAQDPVSTYERIRR